MRRAPGARRARAVERGPERDAAAERVADERARQEARDEVDERERLGRHRLVAEAAEIGRDDVEAASSSAAPPAAATAGSRRAPSAGGPLVSPRAVACTPVGVLDGWRYCSVAAAARSSRRGPPALPACGERYWANPLPASRACSCATAASCSRGARSSPVSATGTFRAASSRRPRQPELAVRRELREETGLELDSACSCASTSSRTAASTCSRSPPRDRGTANRSPPTTSPSSAGSLRTSSRARWRSRSGACAARLGGARSLERVRLVG